MDGAALLAQAREGRVRALAAKRARRAAAFQPVDAVFASDTFGGGSPPYRLDAWHLRSPQNSAPAATHPGTDLPWYRPGFAGGEGALQKGALA